MPTYNGWNVITMPSSPAPKNIEPVMNDVVGIKTNPFSGKMQIQDWNAHYMELSVSMPPMSATDAATWVDFLVNCKGVANVFQISNPAFAALIPASAATVGYWRLKTNKRKWSVNDGVIYGLQFDIREAT